VLQWQRSEDWIQGGIRVSRNVRSLIITKRLVTVLGDSIQLEKSSSENGPKITFLITLVDSLVCLVASCGAYCNNSFVC
jgi:hypothetical protein